MLSLDFSEEDGEKWLVNSGGARMGGVGGIRGEMTALVIGDPHLLVFTQRSVAANPRGIRTVCSLFS